MFLPHFFQSSGRVQIFPLIMIFRKVWEASSEGASFGLGPLAILRSERPMGLSAFRTTTIIFFSAFSVLYFSDSCRADQVFLGYFTR